MSWKSYSHTVRFTGTINPFIPENPLYWVHCLDCDGCGADLINYHPGSVVMFPVPKCKSCSGKGVPPIPACEIGL